MHVFLQLQFGRLVTWHHWLVFFIMLLMGSLALFVFVQATIAGPASPPGVASLIASPSPFLMPNLPPSPTGGFAMPLDCNCSGSTPAPTATPTAMPTAMLNGYEDGCRIPKWFCLASFLILLARFLCLRLCFCRLSSKSSVERFLAHLNCMVMGLVFFTNKDQTSRAMARLFFYSILFGIAAPIGLALINAYVRDPPSIDQQFCLRLKMCVVLALAWGNVLEKTYQTLRENRTYCLSPACKEVMVSWGELRATMRAFQVVNVLNSWKCIGLDRRIALVDWCEKVEAEMKEMYITLHYITLHVQAQRAHLSRTSVSPFSSRRSASGVD